MALSDFLTALRGAPASIQAIDKQLAKLYAERDALKASPPHIDDVTAWAVRGIDNASADALGRLKSFHFNAESLSVWTGETFDEHAGPNILSLTTGKPHPARAGGNISGPAPSGSAPDANMLVHFLRGAIEPELVRLVAESFGDACKDGIKSSERTAKLAKVGAKISTLESERAELAQAVQETVRHLSAAQAASDHNVTPAEIAAEAAAIAREAAAEALESGAQTVGV